MILERVLRGVSGTFVLVGVTLAFVHHRYWLYFLGLVGLMQLQSAFTDQCPMIWLLEKMGFRRCGKADERPAPSPIS